MIKTSKDTQIDLGATVRNAIPVGYRQSRVMSFVEAVTNVLVGYGVAVVTQILIFPIFDLHTTLAQNLKMGFVFTILCGAPHNKVYAEQMIMRSGLGETTAKS
jgi:hypothetical protein